MSTVVSALTAMGDNIKSQSNLFLMHTQNSFQSALAIMAEHYQNARYEEAYKLAISITQEQPDHPFAWKILGALLQSSGNMQGALFAHKTVIRLDPSDPEAFYNLSNTLKALGKLEDAVQGYKNSISIKPDIPEAYLNLGVTLQELGKFQDAELSYKKAIALRPKYAEAFNNLGNVQREKGRLNESLVQYQKAIELKPKYSEALNNLGIVLQSLKKFSEAEHHYKTALALKSDFAEAHYNLGTLLQELARLTEAEVSYKKAIALKQDYEQAYHNLGITLLEMGSSVSALEVFAKLIEFKPSEEVKNLFIDTLKNIHPTLWDPALASMVTSALLEPWGKSHDIARFACQLLKLEPDFQKILLEFEGGITQDTNIFGIARKNSPLFSLLYAILISGPIPDRQLEKYFSSMRLHFLKFANSPSSNQTLGDNEALYGALAQQCFINEYIYYQSSEEQGLGHSLRDRLTEALNEQQEVPPFLILAVGCYFPLHGLKQSDALLEKKYSKDVMAVLKQQIQEPLEEFGLKSGISTLTDFDGQVSLAVQSQYEQSPYPRWVKLPKASNSKSLNLFISKKYPAVNFSPLPNDENLEVLVVGCGTGEHSITCSQVIKGANILAIDLSMSSLAYAKRKTMEMGIKSIEYAQADLLKLSCLGRTFDVIEAVGVLHHLERPFEGWKTLLSMLRPNGLMRLGFYSELARNEIVMARELVKRDGIQPTPEGIRNYRHYLLGLKNFDDIEYLAGGVDFYSMSGCHDLIFHVQEHRMRLDMISEFLEEHQLKLLGLDIDRSSLAAYKVRFPNDSSCLNLKNWHIFEKENPRTFRQMYQLLVQKRA